MLEYSFYTGEYAGNSIPEDAWAVVQRDAEAQLARYERVYTVVYPKENARSMALCAIADAIYAFDQLLAGGGAVQSASVGSVSESYATADAPDTSDAARQRELYRCASLYADIYRGC